MDSFDYRSKKKKKKKRNIITYFEGKVNRRNTPLAGQTLPSILRTYVYQSRISHFPGLHNERPIRRRRREKAFVYTN